MPVSRHPGGTDARTVEGCTCFPEQVGPIYATRVDCPAHGLATLDVSHLGVRFETEDGIKVAAATLDGANRMVARMRARRDARARLRAQRPVGRF
jgi:hypothetical protein